MHSGSPLYQLLLVLVSLGGFSVMLCFVFLLPAVGNWLVAVAAHTIGEGMHLKRKGESIWEQDPG